MTPWHDEVQPFAKQVAEEYQAKYKKPFIMNAAYPFDTILVIADALERAKSIDREALTKALRQTHLTQNLHRESHRVRRKGRQQGCRRGIDADTAREG